MNEYEQKEFEMFSDVLQLRKKCRNTDLTFLSVKEEAQKIVKCYRTDICNELVKVVMNDYCINQEAIQKGKN